MATIDDVARNAGVSPKTVSRFFNERDKVSAGTCRRIENAVRELRFQPNAHARALAANRSRTIALCIGYGEDYFFRNPYFSEVLRGISSTCNKGGYDVLFRADSDCRLLDLSRSGKVDGLLYICPRLDEVELEELQADGFPFVLIVKGAENSPYCWVGVDGELGAHTAVQHLLGLGHRGVAFIGGSPQYLTYQNRLSGYIRALSESGLNPRHDWILPSLQPDQDGGCQTMHALLGMAERPTAVFAFNDLVAMGALEALREAGVEVPGGMAVVGFDDIPMAPYTTPSLSTMAQPAAEMGALSAQMLLKLLEGEPLANRHLVLRPRLIIRRTCGAASNRLQTAGDHSARQASTKIGR